MKITVNGAPTEAKEGTTVEELVASLGAPERGVAVALNGEVVPRSTWDSTEVKDADRVEVVRAVGGG